MLSLRDRYTNIIFFCLSGIVTCLLCLLFFRLPNRLIFNIDPRIATPFKTAIIDSYHKHHPSMPSFSAELKQICPTITDIRRHIKPNGTYVKISLDTPMMLLTPANLVVCKSGNTIPSPLLTDEQKELLENIEIIEDITPRSLSTIIDFVLHKAPLLTPYFEVCWHNKSCITLRPHTFINKHRYTLVIDHTHGVNTVMINILQKFVEYHAELKKNQKTNNWIVDLRFDDWWIIHTRGLEGARNESNT